MLGGNLISAIIGVSCVKLIPHLFLAAPPTVSPAILAMHYLRCMNPPGGAPGTGSACPDKCTATGWRGT